MAFPWPAPYANPFPWGQVSGSLAFPWPQTQGNAFPWSTPFSTPFPFPSNRLSNGQDTTRNSVFAQMGRLRKDGKLFDPKTDILKAFGIGDPRYEAAAHEQAQQQKNQIQDQRNLERQAAAINPEVPSPIPPASGSGAGGGTSGSWGPGEAVAYQTMSAPSAIQQWAPQIQQVSAKYGVPPEVIMALMMMESSGNQYAQSSMNYDPQGNPIGRAQGLMQVMPSHFQAGEDPYDPLTNIDAGIGRVYKPAYDRWGNKEAAAAAYFGAVDSQGRPTNDQDVTGTSGTSYVQQFLNLLTQLAPGAHYV